MSERRTHDEGPPDGVDRRHCADAGCRAAREEWFSSTVLPKLMIKFGAMILGAVTVLSGVFLYMSKNAIRDFALEAKSEYVSLGQHRDDIGRVESKIDTMSITITASMDDVKSMLDRNLQEIQEKKK